MQTSIEISATNAIFHNLMMLAHTSLCDQADNGLFSEPVSYTGPGVVLGVQAGKPLVVYAVATDVGPSLSIEAACLGDAIYLLLDAMQASRAGVFEQMLTGAVERLDAETECISGYPQVFAWV